MRLHWLSRAYRQKDRKARSTDSGKDHRQLRAPVTLAISHEADPELLTEAADLTGQVGRGRSLRHRRRQLGLAPGVGGGGPTRKTATMPKVLTTPCATTPAHSDRYR